MCGEGQVADCATEMTQLENKILQSVMDSAMWTWLIKGTVIMLHCLTAPSKLTDDDLKNKHTSQGGNLEF